MSRIQIDIPNEQLQTFCQKWKIEEFALFGSVLREDFRPDSDIDVLVRFNADARWDLFDFGEMREELVTIFKRDVDLLEREGVEKSRNPIRRKSILETAQVIHAAA